MSDQNIFNQDQNNQTPGNNQPNSNGQPQVPNHLLTLLENVKNESGQRKYKSVEEALIALDHSQNYIPQLKSELDETKRKLAEAEANQNKIEELERTLNTLTQNNKSNENTPSNGMSEEQIAELVTKTLTKVQTDSVQKQNLNKVVGIMREKFGDKAEEMFYGKAEELGMSKQEVNSLAAKSPQAVLTMLGIGAQTTTQVVTPTSSGYNGSSFQPQANSEIKANKQKVLIGASGNQVIQEMNSARKMVDELHAAGLSTYDLSDPKVYNKYFT